MIKNIRAALIKPALLLMVFFAISNSFAQYNKDLLKISNTAKEDDPDVLLKKLNRIKSQIQKPADKALYKKTLAHYFSGVNNDAQAFKALIESQKIYKSIDSTDAAMETNRLLFNTIFYSEATTTDPWPYAEEYLKYAEATGNRKKMLSAFLMQADYYQVIGKGNMSLKYYRKALSYALSQKDRASESVVYTNLSLLFSDYLKKPDSALYYLKKDLPYIEKHGDLFDLSSNYANQAAAYTVMGNYPKAIEVSKMAFALPIKKYRNKEKEIFAYRISGYYSQLKDFKNAYEYLEISHKYHDSVREEQQNTLIRDLETKYKAKAKDLENKVLRGDIKTNRVILYTSIAIALAIAAISALIIKNSKKKEKISRQEKIIEQQKLEKALKEHELQSIDLLLEGQERERQRIANDLHDNLGSMLATLKMNFENLNMRKNGVDATETMLFERTDELIEEAYHKVRRLAHTNNAGVLAAEGLIPAVKKLVDKITIPGKLDMQFIPYGFTKPLDNTLEIAIFRLIQELSTNIIKHSQATEATVQLTNHEDAINIIIEDNGVGFDTSKIKKDGMGLETIYQKIAQLKGSITIDSTPGKGATIIIELPL